jgi:hypothetical protein
MQYLPFVHPWIAVCALALASIPVVIHILNRRRFRRVIWAAMDFLTAAYRRNARRVRIEQLILLAVRVLIMVLIAMALARPWISPASPAGLGQISRHRIVVLDDSYPMGMAGPGGQRTYDRGIAAIRKLSNSFGRNDRVTLIRAGRPARMLTDQPSYDSAAMLRALERHEISDATKDVPGVLSLAADCLAQSRTPSGNRAVYFLTDGTAAAWTGGSRTSTDAIRMLAHRVAEEGRLFIVDLGPEDRDNLAISSLRVPSPALSADWPATLEAEVTNYGRQDAANLRLQLVLDGQAVRTESVETVPPLATKTVRLRVQLPGAGSHQVCARLVGEMRDALAADNARWLSVAVRREVPILLVDGRPGTDRFSGQTGYLATALAPRSSPADLTPVTPRVIMTPELATEPLDDYAMVALCDVRALPEQVWARVERYVRRGGGLIVLMGDQVSQDDYNRFGFADGRGILPARISGLVGSLDDREKFVRIRTDPVSHPCVADFVGQPRSGLFLTRFFRYARLSVPPDLPGAGVALRYDNGDVALAVRHVNRGRVAMASFAANMDWSNLPAKGDYVSLMMGLLSWIVGDPAAERNVIVGEPLSEALSSRAASLPVEVICPDAHHGTAAIASQPASDRVLARYDQTDRVGGYRLMVGSEPIDFSVNLDTVGSDLRRIAPEGLREILGTTFEYSRDIDQVIAAGSQGAHREIAWLLLWAVLGLLLLEMALAMRFGHHRE